MANVDSMTAIKKLLKKNTYYEISCQNKTQNVH